MHRNGWWLVGLVVLVACDGAPESPDAGADDGGTLNGGRRDSGGATPRCERDEDCSDGVYCNGQERCVVGEDRVRACAAGAPPCEEGACDENGQRCLTACEIEPDRDGDGWHRSECAGLDCDDDDPDVYHAAPERCNGVDDDCDSRTDEGPVDIGSRSHCAACGDACQLECRGGECATVIAIDAGRHHTCAVGSTGFVRCWGGNDRGQLGDGTMVDRPYAVAAIASGALTPAPVSVAAGAEHTCVTDGVGVLCWGRNDHGQLGLGHTDPVLTPTRLAFPASPVHELDAGGDVTCAIAGPDRRAYCWGRRMQNVDDVITDALEPRLVTHLDDVVDLAVGQDFVCALEDNVRISCWGQSGYGNLGDTRNGFVYVPNVMRGFSYVMQLVAGDHFVCGIRGMAPHVFCWGDDQHGQLGDGPTARESCPRTTACSTTPVYSDYGVRHEGFAGGASVCMLGERMFCWGDNRARQISATAGDAITLPEPALGLLDERVAMGATHLCRQRRLYGDVRCQGTDDRGVIGDGEASPGMYADADVVPPPGE